MLSDDELWYWHAYDYGWRRVRLEDFSQVSPIDPDGRWFNPGMAHRTEQLERYLMTGLRETVSQEAVREDFELLPIHRWTQAECALRTRETEDLCRERGYPSGPEGWVMVAKDNIAAAEAKWRTAFRPPSQRGKPAQEIPPPKGFERATVSPEELRALNARLGYDDPAEPQAPV